MDNLNVPQTLSSHPSQNFEYSDSPTKSPTSRSRISSSSLGTQLTPSYSRSLSNSPSKSVFIKSSKYRSRKNSNKSNVTCCSHKDTSWGKNLTNKSRTNSAISLNNQSLFGFATIMSRRNSINIQAAKEGIKHVKQAHDKVFKKSALQRQMEKEIKVPGRKY